MRFFRPEIMGVDSKLVHFPFSRLSANCIRGGNLKSIGNFDITDSKSIIGPKCGSESDIPKNQQVFDL